MNLLFDMLIDFDGKSESAWDGRGSCRESAYGCGSDPRDGHGSGDGSGNGYGYGYGNGDGDGDGDGNGNGNGYGEAKGIMDGQWRDRKWKRR